MAPTDPSPAATGTTNPSAASNSGLGGQQQHPAAVKEATFRNFTPDQATKYATFRRDYNPKLYKLILDRHAATGGGFDTIVDLGCGPGTVVRSLAPRFKHAFGFDPSEGMIATARQLGGTAAALADGDEEPIKFAVSTAEDIGNHPDTTASTTGTVSDQKEEKPLVADGSVDMITAGTAAHWFDMPRFWRRAAAVLKPGGTVAVWSIGTIRADPRMPYAAEMQAAADELEAGYDEYLAPGNRLTRDLYRGMAMPWDVINAANADGGKTDDDDDEVLGVFDKEAFYRQEWGTTEPDAMPMDDFLAENSQAPSGASAAAAPPVKITPALLAGVMSTASPVIRWREAHPDLAHTEDDLVVKFQRRVEKCLTDKGVPFDAVKGGMSGVLLIVKKKE